MFGFLGMMGNYEARKVARYEENDILVSTCGVTDGRKPFETAVAHPDYNDGGIVVVESYSTKEKAQAGHDKWVKVMTSKDLPATLTDIINSSDFDSFVDKREFSRKSLTQEGQNDD